MKAYKIFLDNLKEETWINEMAKQGWLINKIGFGYTFEKSEEKTNKIEMDYRLFKSEDDFKEYITLHEDYGWKHLAGSKSSGAQYFTHDGSDPDMTLFSDTESQKARIVRIRQMLRQMIAISLVLFIVSISSSDFTFSTLINPSLLYQTPNLWSLTGSEFWSAFIFETPFAIFRGALIYALPLMMIIYAIVGYKIQHKFNTTISKLT